MKINRASFEQYILILLFFFVSVWPQATTFCIILYILINIPKFNKEKLFLIFQRKELLSFILIYIVLILGIFYTIDLNSGISKLQTQIVFIILPVFMGSISINKNDRITYINSFVMGLMVTILICLAHATYRLVNNGSLYVRDEFSRIKNIFFYDEFSKVLDLHPTYFAMYIGVGILYFIVYYNQILFGRERIKNLILFFLFVCMFLTSSKGAILALFIVLIVVFPIALFKKFLKAKIVLTIIAISAIMVILFTNTTLNKRYTVSFHTIGNILDENDSYNESTSIRFNLWKLSYYNFLEKPIMGSGTGSVKKALNNNCLNFFDFSTCEFLRNMNSHNQYLNALVSNGLILFLLILFSLIRCVVSAYKKNDLLYLLFVLFMGINFTFESVLQRERGVVFFMLFIVLFSISNFETKKLNE